MRFENKSIVITGGGGGIGRGIATVLAAEGGSVLLADVDGERARAVADTIVRSGGRAIGVACDITQEDAVEAMIGRAVSEFGRVDVLVNNAFDSSPLTIGLDSLPLTEFDVRALDNNVAVNLRGSLFCCKYALRDMVKNSGGVIINIVSTAALKGGRALTCYGACKAGLISLTRHIAVSYGKENIRCNAIAPGTTVHERMLEQAPASILSTDTVLTNRMGRPEDIAYAVAYLASDQAAQVTGQVLPVDGGSTVGTITMPEGGQD